MIKNFIAIVLTLFTTTAFAAANHAIRPDCPTNGNGSSWACGDAYNALPATLTRGDTYYFGDGTLTQSYSLDDANSGTTYVYFKKATPADYGGLANWNALYGDGQTIFNSNDGVYGSIFYYTYGSTNGYYSFDGVKGIGSTNPDDYGFAFKQTNRNPSSSKTSLIFNGENGYAIGQIVSNCAFVTLGSECVSDGCYHNGTRCQQAIAGGLNATYYGNLFKGSDNPLWALWGGTTVDSNIFMDHWSDSSVWYSPITEYGCHGQQIVTQSSNITIKNNIFLDTTGSATISDPYNSVHTVNGWYIYNNVFLNNTAGGGVLGREDPMAATYNDIKFYNNTIYSANGFFDMRYLTGGSGNEVKNNLFYGSSYGFLTGSTGGSSWTWGNNYHDSTSSSLGGFSPSNDQTETIGATTLFNSPSTYDFTLKSGASVVNNTGVNLSSLFTVDRAGNTRTVPWDIGAYEYGSGSPDNPMTVSAGADRNTNTASETVTGTAADLDTVASVAWVNDRGGSGSCTGTTSWYCGSITMVNGLNTITVTATDSLGGIGSDSIVLTYYEAVANNTTISITVPQLVYIKASSAGNFKITGSVNAADGGTNSVYIDIGSDPANDNTKAWHMDLTTGYENQDARWGTWDVPDAYQSPTIWALSGANQILYVRTRESGTLIQSVKFVSTGIPNPDETAPTVTILTSSPQSISSDALTVTGTATDAIWGVGSVCKFRVGAEPDIENGTACTDTLDWLCAATGFAEGANTLYIECADAVPNWSTGHSISVYLSPAPPDPPSLPAATMRGVSSFTGGTVK